MQRTLEDIARDLESIEVVMKNNAHTMMQVMANLAGTVLPADLPDPRQIPNYIVLPDGRSLQLSDLANELRRHSISSGDFRERP